MPSQNPASDLGFGLADLDLSEPKQEEPVSAQEDPKTTTELFHQSKEKEERRRDDWHNAQLQFDARLQQWTGHPQKNHVRVLLCTLPDVLWEGHNFKRLGMGDLEEPN